MIATGLIALALSGPAPDIEQVRHKPHYYYRVRRHAKLPAKGAPPIIAQEEENVIVKIDCPTFEQMWKERIEQ